MRYDMDGQNKFNILKDDESSPQGIAIGELLQRKISWWKQVL